MGGCRFYDMKKNTFGSLTFCLLLLVSLAGCAGKGAETELYASHKPYTRWWWFAAEIDDGDNLPDFWVREEGDTYYIFFANPLTQNISYPLDYCYAFTDKGSVRDIVVNHHGKSERCTLRFHPMESILLEVTKRGIRQIDLGYTPRRL